MFRPVVRLACHGRSSEHVGKNEMSLLTGGVLFVDDLDVRPIEYIISEVPLNPSRVHSTQQQVE